MLDPLPYRVITACPQKRYVFLWAGEPGEGEPLALPPVLFLQVFGAQPPEPGARLLLRYRLERPQQQRDPLLYREG